MTSKRITDDMTLTTEHPASSYGQPVLLFRGVAYGPHDLLPEPEGEFGQFFAQRTAAEEVAAHITHGNELVETFLRLAKIA